MCPFIATAANRGSTTPKTSTIFRGASNKGDKNLHLNVYTTKIEEQFDTIGNAPVVWFESAMDLLMASAEVGRTSGETSGRLGFPFTRSFWPRLMLRAFAVECLIKAHYLLSKRKLCVGGKYAGS